METFNSLGEALAKYPNSYVSHEQYADCMVCGEYKDLRCGACFACCDKVIGEPIKDKYGEVKGHWLWAKDKPETRWMTGV